MADRCRSTLARRLVARLYAEDAAEAAAARFERLFVQHAEPDEIEDVAFAPDNGAVHLPALIADAFGRTRSDARRLLAQGAVKLDGEPLAAEDLDVPLDELDGCVLQLGKRRFARLVRG